MVGGGPAGSATAVHLARRGIETLVVDRAAFPRDKVCSEYMSPETVRLLDRLGIVADLEAAGACPLAGTTVIGPRGASLTGTFALAGLPPYRPTGLSIARRELDARLLRAARDAGVQVVERAAVEDLLLDGRGVGGAVVRGPDGRRLTIRSRLTVGADGLHSVVARRIDGRRRHFGPSRLAFVAHVQGVSGLTSRAEMHVGAAGYVGLNPIGRGVTNVALVVPRARVARARGQVEDFFFETLEEFAGVRGRINRGAVVRRVLATGPFAAWARRVTTDGAMLVGDAADFFDPFTGEGIYSALRGAELAAETAASALAEPGHLVDSRLRSYQSARRKAFLGKWAVERLIGYGMLVPRLFDRAVARLGRRRGMADTLIGVTADFIPARAVLNPVFLARMVL